jgi:hypothetical protein
MNLKMRTLILESVFVVHAENIGVQTEGMGEETGGIVSIARSTFAANVGQHTGFLIHNLSLEKHLALKESYPRSYTLD